MPPFPADLQAVEAALTVAYRDAWTAVVSEQQRVAQGLALNPRLWRQRDRLAEVRRRIEHEMANVDAMARHWVSREYPRFYAAGAQAAAEKLHSPFTWTQTHRDALVLLSKDTYDDLLEATAFVRADTKRFLREVVKDQVVRDQLVGKTAKQTARNVTHYLQGRGITSVVYANGARHSLADYADMAIRTKTAVGYNIGTLNQGAEFGVKFYEVFDGPSCGWSAHDDTELANGKIVSTKEASTYVIAHPRCARSFGARPDLVDPKAAKLAQPTPGGQQLARREAPGLPLEAATRTREARAAARARRATAGLEGRVRTPQRVLERRAAMLQKVRLPRGPRGPRRPPPEEVAPPAPPPTGPPPWRAELDDVLARRPTAVQGSDAVDRFGNPTPASYAQEAWVREVGAVVDREVLRRTDDFVAKLGEVLDIDGLQRQLGETLEELVGLGAGWDDMAQRMYGKMFRDLPSSKERAEVLARLKAGDKRRAALAKQRDALRERLEGMQDTRAIAYRQAAEEVMGEIRPMGTGGTDSWRWIDQAVKKHGSGHGEAKKTLDHASRFFPQDWIDNANRWRPIRTGVIKRGKQTDYRRWVDIMLSRGGRGALLPDDPDMMAVATHELSHLMETVDPRIRAFEHAFHHRRTTDFTAEVGEVIDQWTGERIPRPPKQEAMSNIYGSSRERGRKDKWSEHYMGKVYGGNANGYWEHLSMGMEGIWAGRFKMLEDDDYRAWVLGLLVAL